MAEKATIVGSSTLGESIKPVEVTEPIAATPENQNTEIVVTPEGALETAPTATEVITPEENEMAFSFPFENETSASTPETTTQQPQTDWKQLLKNLDKKEVAKELGLDEFDIEFADYRKKGGDPTKYIAAKAIDWNKVADIDLVRADFNEKYKALSTEDANYLFNKKYVISDIDDEDAQRDKRIALQTEGFDIRQKRIAEQQSFKMPETIEPQKDEAYEQYRKSIAEQNTSREATKQFLVNHEATKNLLQNKRVAIPISKDGKVFNFNIDKPEGVLAAMMDGGKTWGKLISTEKGEPDVEKQQKLILFASNPDKFVEDIFNYGVSQGMKKKIEEGQNARRQSGQQPRNSVNTTEKEAWKTNAKSSVLGAVN